MIKLPQVLLFLDWYIMALSIYNVSSLSSELVGVIRNSTTLESGIDVGQGINVGPGKFVKKE